MAYKVKRVRLETSEQDKKILDSQSRIANHLYNTQREEVVGEFDYFDEHGVNKEFNPFNEIQLRNQVTKLKAIYPFYKTLHSLAARNVALRLAQAIADWNNPKLDRGFPNFRNGRKEGFFTLTYDEPFNGYKIKDGILDLSLGKELFINKKGKEQSKQIHLKMRLRNKLKFELAQICILEIVQDKYDGEFWAHFTIEVPDMELKPIKRMIAFDPNHKNLMVGYDSDSNIFTFDNYYLIKRIDKGIDKLKSKLDRCKKYSRRWTFLNKRLQQLNAQRRDQIKVFLRTISNALCKKYDLIGIGNYVPEPQTCEVTKSDGKKIKKNIKSMNRVMINQTFIGAMRTTLKQIAARSGKSYFKYDEYRTTKICSTCNHKGESLDPSIREWTCEACQAFHIRDENAAMNGYLLLQRYLNGEANPIMEGSNKMNSLETKDSEEPCSGYGLPIGNRYTCRFDGRGLRWKSQSGPENQEIKYIKANDIVKTKCDLGAA